MSFLMATDETISLFSLFYHVLSLKSSFISDIFPLPFSISFPFPVVQDADMPKA